MITQDIGYNDHDGHLCSTPAHTCGEPCSLQVPDGYTCLDACVVNWWVCSFLLFRISCLGSHDQHDQHQCGLGQPCLIRCQLSASCDSYCSSRDHFHALKEGAIHLCRYESLAEMQFITHGISEIPMHVPTSVMGQASVKLIQFHKKAHSNFDGYYKHFNFTKVSIKDCE